MRQRRRYFALACAAMLLTAPAAQARCERGETVIKFSHVVAAQGSPKGDAAKDFAARVNAAMDGRVCVEVYPASTLYDDNKVLEAMLLGDVQMAAPSLSKMEKYTKAFRIFDFPFLFKNDAAVYRFQDSPAGAKLAQALEEKGLLMLAYWPNGMKQISARRPLTVPADAAGLKFRIMSSNVLKKQYEALNASPQKLAFKEVYGALQTGVVDGQENTYSNIYTRKFFEVQAAITETNHGILTYGVVTSAAFWKGLRRQDRAQLEQILAETTAAARAEAAHKNRAARQAILAAGGRIITLSDAQRAAWVQAMQPVWRAFRDDVGADILDAALAANR